MQGPQTSTAVLQAMHLGLFMVNTSRLGEVFFPPETFISKLNEHSVNGCSSAPVMTQISLLADAE